MKIRTIFFKSENVQLLSSKIFDRGPKNCQLIGCWKNNWALEKSFLLPHTEKVLNKIMAFL